MRATRFERTALTSVFGTGWMVLFSAATAHAQPHSARRFSLPVRLATAFIMGILAAIALPAFFNQKEKAGDSKAKEYDHSAQVAMETCATENGGEYVTACNTLKIEEIEPSLKGTGTTVTPNVPVGGYTVKSEGSSGYFEIVRKGDGELEFPCEHGGEGACNLGETKGAVCTWGE